MQTRPVLLSMASASLLLVCCGNLRSTSGVVNPGEDADAGEDAGSGSGGSGGSGSGGNISGGGGSSSGGGGGGSSGSSSGGFFGDSGIPVPFSNDSGSVFVDDGGTLLGYDGGASACVPGQSVTCAGPGACLSTQVCNAAGNGYDGDCVCPNDAGGLPDGYAPLPPTIGNQDYNAVWSASTQTIYRPLFTAPDCSVIPPYGQFYAAELFNDPISAGPDGTLPDCRDAVEHAPCYQPEIDETGGTAQVEYIAGGVYTLSAFNSDGVAIGQMDTAQGIVPLVVKSCP